MRVFQRVSFIFAICCLSGMLVLSGGWLSAAQADNPPAFATKWGTMGSANGQFNRPRGLTTDSSGNIYVADTENNRIQKFDSSGNFILRWTSSGSTDGQFVGPYGVALDSSGNLYVADTGKSRIQKLSSAGGFITQWGSYGTADSQFGSQYGIASDNLGNVYVADTYNNRIQKFANNGAFIAKWGTLGAGDNQFSMPFGVIADTFGNIYVADTGNNRIVKFANNGNFIAKWGTPGGANGQFNSPTGLAADSAGNVYVTDKDNNRVQKFDSAGNWMATWGAYGSADGQFVFPWGIATDNSGNVYVSDTDNNRIQKFAYPPPSQTRIISLTGDMNFGSVNVGSIPQRTLTISNTGNSALTVSSIFYPAGFSGAQTAVIPAGGFQNITVTLATTNVGTYSGLLTVNSDKTGGVNTISVSGTVTAIVQNTSVTRILPCYRSGNKFTVTLVVTPSPGTGNYALEDSPPPGWSVSNLSNAGVYDSSKNKVKFGPFYDAVNRTLTYDVTPPITDAADRSFLGTISADGINFLIGGNYLISQCQIHPADITPTDFSISIAELTAYGAAWRNGASWSLPPSPVQIEYLTRAGALWKGGETYRFDPTAGSPPLCWVNVTTQSARSLRSSESSAIRQIVPTDNAFAVSVAVTPASTVLAYAVEDRIPEGWIVSAISDNGTFEANARIVKFGLFTDNQPRNLSYRIMSASGSEPVFTGVASFDGKNTNISLRDEVQPLPGDIDGTPGVGLGDAIFALKVLSGIAVAPPNMTGDVNGDRKIGLEEVIFILQTVAGIR